MEERKSNVSSKRSNGEGTIYQRTDGSWVYQITTVDDRGNKIRKSFTGKTRKAAKEKHKKFLSEQEQIRHKIAMGLSITGGDIAKQTISLSNWVFDWIQLYKKPPLVKETTYATYMHMWDIHIQPFFGDDPLAAISNEDIQLFYNYLLTSGRKDTKEGGLSPKTLRNIHNMLHSSLNMAVGKIIIKNPTEETTRPSVPMPEVRVLTTEEMEIFIKEIYNERLKVAMFISLFTGVRMGELLALTWDDVDIKKKTLHINKDFVRISNYNNDDGTKNGSKLIVQDTPKSKKSNRFIPLYDEVFRMLMMHREVQRNSRYPNPNNLLFPSRVGTHTDPRTYQKRVAAVSKRCEMQRVNTHALRHTFATRLVEQNVPLRIIQDLLGHSGISTVMRYTHAMTEEKEKAIGTIGSFLQGV